MANKRKQKKKKGLQQRWTREKLLGGITKQLDIHKEDADSVRREESSKAEEVKKDEPVKAAEPAKSPVSEPEKKDEPVKAAEPAKSPVSEPEKKDEPVKAAESVKSPVAEPEKKNEPVKAAEPEKKDEPAKETADEPSVSVEVQSHGKTTDPVQKTVTFSVDQEGEDESMRRKLFLQYNNLEFSDDVMFRAAVRDYCTWAGISEDEITSVNLYVKPEEGKAYYVINDDADKNGSIDL